jgi:aspartate ammonia-lyase
MAAAHGEFELNAFLPLIADTLLENLSLLEGATDALRVKCIETLTADRERCEALLEGSYAFAASYAPILGYDRVAEIIKENDGDPARIRETLKRSYDRSV